MKRISVTLLLAAAAVVVALWFLRGRAGFQDAEGPKQLPDSHPVMIVMYIIIGVLVAGSIALIPWMRKAPQWSDPHGRRRGSL